MNDESSKGIDIWNEARSRLAEYLGGLGVASPEHQIRIAQLVIERAIHQAENCTQATPVHLAFSEFHQLVEEWFMRLLGSREHVSATGMLTFYAVDAPRRWPNVFLAEEVPMAFYQAIRQSIVCAAPDLEVSSMVPQPFANPLPDTIVLPAPLAGIVRELSPIMAKLFGFVLALFATWPGKFR